jgi:hypothetical protein
MLYSRILRRVALVRIDIPEERIAPIIRVRLLVTVNIHSSPIFVTVMIATRRNIPEDGIPHSHRRENLKSYIALIGWAL